MTLNVLHGWDGHICDVGAAEISGGLWRGEFRIEKDGTTLHRGSTIETKETNKLAEELALEEAQEWVSEKQGTTVGVNARVFELHTRDAARLARQWVEENLGDTSGFQDEFSAAAILAAPGMK